MASSHANSQSQQSEHGIHDMISKLTDRLVSLGQETPEHENKHHAQYHETDPGVRIITLAGENKGAAMKGTSLDELVDSQGRIYNDENLMSAYTNSNYQAVNNSIMLEGKYSAEDPGVHIIISDNLDDDSSTRDDSSDDSDSDSESEESDNEDRKGKKEKKKKKKKSKKKKDGKKKEKDGKKKKGTEHHSETETETETESEKEEKDKEKGKHTD